VGEFYCDCEFTLGLDVITRWEGGRESCEGGGKRWRG